MVETPKINEFYFYDKRLYQIIEINSPNCVLKAFPSKEIITTYSISYFKENSNWKVALEHEIPKEYRKDLLQNLMIW